MDYNASPLGGPLRTIYGVHNEEGRCVICVGCNALRCDGSPFLQPSTGWMPVHLGPSNIPPSSMYGNNTLIRSPKWVLPYGGGCWVPSPLWGEVDAGYPSRVNSYLGLALGTHELITDTERCTIPPKPLYRLLCCIAEYVIFICHATVLHPFILELICITCVC